MDSSLSFGSALYTAHTLRLTITACHTHVLSVLTLNAHHDCKHQGVLFGPGSKLLAVLVTILRHAHALVHTTTMGPSQWSGACRPELCSVRGMFGQHADDPASVQRLYTIFWCAVEESIIALVRLYQQFTFQLSENCSEPLQLTQGITLSPKGGIPVYVIQRAKTWNDTVSIAHAKA